MRIDLRDKNALVCGGSQGIGLAAAQAMADCGANVTLVSRSPEKLTEALSTLASVEGQDHDFLVADFNDPLELKKKMTGLAAGRKYQILVNNTGGPAAGKITESETSSFEQAFRQHIICAHIITKALLQGMKSSGYGRIINVISTSVKEPLTGLGVSNTIRGAMGNWAKTLAGEIGPDGITVNNVLPGATNTQRLQNIIHHKAKKSGHSEDEVIQKMQSIIPLNRFAQPEELGSVIAFLASPLASYITGINVPVDGGRTRSL